MSVCADVLNKMSGFAPGTIDEVFLIDQQAREIATKVIHKKNAF
jgi:hypothetical protein